MSEDVFIDMLEDDPFPAPQEKPARRLNYAEKCKAGMVERKPRQRINPVSAKRAREGVEYTRLRKAFLTENPVVGQFENKLKSDLRRYGNAVFSTCQQRR